MIFLGTPWCRLVTDGLVPPATGGSGGKIVRLKGGANILYETSKDLYQKLISDENLRLAILTVNATHKWHPPQAQ
ncbi:MAG: hypothetical protein ACLUEK_12330 [Oscillospiraceae bacterium]